MLVSSFPAQLQHRTTTPFVSATSPSIQDSCQKLILYSNVQKSRSSEASISVVKWCHNERDYASNHQPHYCLLKRLSGRRSKKTSKRGIHRRLVKSPHKGPVTRKMFPFDDVIMVMEICTEHTSDLVIILCFVQDSKTGLPSNKIWVNEILRDLSLWCVSRAYCNGPHGVVPAACKQDMSP